MSRPRKSEEWTAESEKALISFMRERPVMWNQNHYDFHYIESKRKAFMECAAMLGPPFTWEKVRDRWTNMRTTFACNYKRSMTKSEGEVPSPRPTWVYYNDLIFLEPIVAARYAAKSQTNNSEGPKEVVAPLMLKMEEEDIPCSPPEYYDYESNSTNTEDYSRPVLEAMEEPKELKREDDEWDDFGRMVAKILRKMEESDAREVQTEFFRILALKSKAKSEVLRGIPFE